MAHLFKKRGGLQRSLAYLRAGLPDHRFGEDTDPQTRAARPGDVTNRLESGVAQGSTSR